MRKLCEYHPNLERYSESFRLIIVSLKLRHILMSKQTKQIITSLVPFFLVFILLPLFFLDDLRITNEYWSKMPQAMHQFARICTLNLTSFSNSLTPVLYPKVLPIFRQSGQSQCTLRLIGDLKNDRQASLPEEVKTIALIDWNFIRGSSFPYEVWNVSLIDTDSQTIIATKNFDQSSVSRPLRNGDGVGTPQISFGKWVNAFPLAGKR